MHDKKDISQRKLELDQAFSTLCNNTTIYFKLLDDLLHPAARSAWIERYTHRAQLCADLYHKNNSTVLKVAKLCMENYDEDVEAFSPDIKFANLEKLSENNLTFYRFLQQQNYPYFQTIHRKLPFVMERVCIHYEKEIEKRMPHSEIAFLLYSTMMETQFQIALLNDNKAVHKMTGYAIKLLKFEGMYDIFSSDAMRVRFLRAYRMLLYPGFINDGGMDPITAINAWKRYKKFCADLNRDMMITNPELQGELKQLRFYCDCFVPAFAYSYYGEHSTEYNNWMMEELTEFVNRYGKPKPDSYMLYCTAQWMLGKKTADEADKLISEYYFHLRWNPKRKYSPQNVIMIIFLIRNSLFLITKSEMFKEVKQMRIMKGLEIAQEALKNRNDRSYSYELTRSVVQMLCDKHLNSFLNTEQHRTSLCSMMRSALPLHYAHCCMVARVSEEILDGIIRYQPELLVGYLDAKSVQEVNDNAHIFYDYVTNAALFHDIGLLSIAPVANNDYVTLSEHEEALYREHPMRGRQFMAIDPNFAPYEDVIMGHHKSYDGKSGFPENFNNRTSPYRIFIDIVHIADSIENSFHNVGQWHNRETEFSSLFDRLYEQAGKEFDPKLMQLVRKHSEVYRNISELVRLGWKNIFFDVFLDYFGRR